MLDSHLRRGLQFRKTGTLVRVVFKFNSEVWQAQRSLTRSNTRQMCGQTHARARESQMHMAAGKNERKPVCPKHCCLKGENKKEGKALAKKSFFWKDKHIFFERSSSITAGDTFIQNLTESPHASGGGFVSTSEGDQFEADLWISFCPIFFTSVLWISYNSNDGFDR